MNKYDAFKDFLAGQAAYIDPFEVVTSLLMAAGMGVILAVTYVYWGRSASNRRAFAPNLVMITLTTTLIIIVVKSSLALSLGLVGALSIVRFRSAVKEHEELAFLFFSIAIGLCLGAGQKRVALISFLVIMVIMMIDRVFRPKWRHENLYLRIRSTGPERADIEGIAGILVKFCSLVKLKRHEVVDDVTETSFLVEFQDLSNLARAKAELKDKFSPLELSFIDNEGLI
jgi:uncharacterized membrane protein YhiD involved in acid resistance